MRLVDKQQQQRRQQLLLTQCSLLLISSSESIGLAYFVCGDCAAVLRRQTKAEVRHIPPQSVLFSSAGLRISIQVLVVVLVLVRFKVEPKFKVVVFGYVPVCLSLGFSVFPK